MIKVGWNTLQKDFLNQNVESQNNMTTFEIPPPLFPAKYSIVREKYSIVREKGATLQILCVEWNPSWRKVAQAEIVDT
jgi:hypothetical protein